MSSIPRLNLIVTAAVILLIIFVPFLRRLVFALLRIAIAVVAAFVAVAGISMLMNNETIYEKPGAKARIIRFITVDHAATSEKGLGTATCKWPDEPAATTAPAPASGPAPGAAAQPESAETEDVYPELMTRSFPGISRQKLFDLSQQVVNSLGGWKIVKSDPHAGVLECIYTSRILGAEDDVRITVTPKGDVELCSRSGTERKGSTSLLGVFPGDFGANIGHIKQFYETLEPKMDEVYKEEQEKENAKKPHGGP
jgi:hypothetical protein